MISCTISFFGDKTGAFGMPKPYNSYLIVASDWQSPGSGVASIVSLSVNAPMPSQQHLLAQSGGPRGALKLAHKALADLPGNVSLKEITDCSD